MQAFHMLQWMAVAASLAFALPAASQQYPTKPVRVITPFPGGSGPDTVIRLVGDRLTRAWGQQVVVENRPGGNGFIAADAAKKAAPDGYTLTQMDDAQLAAQPALYTKLPFDPVKDFEPIATLFRAYFFVVTPANSPWKSVADLVAAAKAKKGEMTYGSWFIGSPGHIGGALMESAIGVAMIHVPFKEMTQLYGAVGNNDVGWAFGSIASAGPLFRAKKVNFLAVASPRRIAGFPDIPTIAESGGPANVEVKAWVALLGPRGLPPAIVAQINDAVGKALADPALKERLGAVGFETFTSSPGEISKLMEADTKRYAEVIKRAKITLD